MEVQVPPGLKIEQLRGVPLSEGKPWPKCVKAIKWGSLRTKKKKKKAKRRTDDKIAESYCMRAHGSQVLNGVLAQIRLLVGPLSPPRRHFPLLRPVMGTEINGLIFTLDQWPSG